MFVIIEIIVLLCANHCCHFLLPSSFHIVMLFSFCLCACASTMELSFLLVKCSVHNLFFVKNVVILLN